MCMSMCVCALCVSVRIFVCMHVCVAVWSSTIIQHVIMYYITGVIGVQTRAF